MAGVRFEHRRTTGEDMSTHAEPETTPEPIGSLLAEPLRVGDPDVAGPLAVFPVFGPVPRLDYESFATARTKGFRIGELKGGASVNDLQVENPTDRNVLLFEGEEVLGAQQNRTFDVSVLIAAGTSLTVPVSCVEAGRWQGGRHAEAFDPAPQAAYPELRRAKATQARQRVAMGMEARATQSEVWSAVADRADRMGTRSDSGAMHDIYEQRRGRLDELTDAVRLHDGQSGALVAINGRMTVFDFTSRPDAFASLHRPLVQGYALDALDQAGDATVDPPGTDTANGFLLLLSDCHAAHRGRGVGLGEELRFVENGIEGSALAHEGELVQATAFPAAADGAPSTHPRAGRVARPSRRR